MRRRRQRRIGWLEGPAPEDWPRDDFGELIPVEADREPEKKPTKSAKSTAKAETKDDD